MWGLQVPFSFCLCEFTFQNCGEMRYTPINCRSFGYIISTHAEYLRARLLVVVQSLSHVQLFACQASLSSTVSQSLLRCISIELVMLSNHLILCHTHIDLFQTIDSLHQVAKKLKLQHQSFQGIFRSLFLLGLTGSITLQSK